MVIEHRIPGPLRAALTDLGLLVLRLSVGPMMFFSHGVSKLGKLTQSPIKFADPLGVGPTVSLLLAAFSEGVCSLLIAVGLATRLSAIPLLITMVVAAFIVHADDPFSKKEFPLLYAILMVTLVFAGPGRWSLDHWLRKRRKA